MCFAFFKHSIVALVLLPASAESVGSSRRIVPLELSGVDTATLWASAAAACRTGVREMKTGSSYYYNGPKYTDFAVVYCAAHEQHEGYSVARHLGCERSNESGPWACGRESLMIETDIDHRTVRILLDYATPRDALEVIGFLLTGPVLDQVSVDRNWFQSDVRVHLSGQRFLVSASNYMMSLTRDPDPSGELRFSLDRITRWGGDVGITIAGE